MRLFPIPTQLTGEEKTFGGVLTIKQVVFIVFSIAISVVSFILLKLIGLHAALCVFISVPLFIFGLALAFIKIQDISLDKFLLFLVRYYIRPRKFSLKGDD